MDLPVTVSDATLLPPPDTKSTKGRSGTSSAKMPTDPIPALEEVRTTHLTLLKHIPFNVRPECADFLRITRLLAIAPGLNDAERLSRFSKLIIFPVAMPCAPCLMLTQTTGVGQHFKQETEQNGTLAWRSVFGTLEFRLGIGSPALLRPTNRE